MQHALPIRVAMVSVLALSAGLFVLSARPAHAADQSQPGAGNAAAEAIARGSPLVQSSLRFLTVQAGRIHDRRLRASTLDLIANPKACVMHRKGLASAAAQDEVIAKLIDAGLINRTDAETFAAGIHAAIFPPLVDAAGDCPQLPQSFGATPGSAFHGHHSFPGGLAVHEANNELSNVNLARQYQAVYGAAGAGGEPRMDADAGAAAHRARSAGDLPIDVDVMIAAPIWHDWAKALVYQWNADGSEFVEFYFGGAGTNDAWGGAGDSRTGGHHILSIAESMARASSPLMVITQASAHSAPTLGNEWKVVNWLRAAAIVARIDPVRAGYLVADGAGLLRLPALGGLGGVDLNAAGQVNFRIEYTLHALSDADFTLSGPAVAAVELVLKTLAPEFGYDAADAPTYNLRFRNPALARLSGERLFALYADKGIEPVRQALKRLRAMKVI